MKPHAFTLLLALSLVPRISTAQPRLYPVAGKVISQADGHPIAHASLSLLSIPERKPLQSTTSDADGAFTFSEVPAGKYELRGEAPGFVRTTYDEHGGFSTAIVTGSTVSAGSLVFELIPRSTLSGTISDSSGDPVPSASLHLFRQAEDFGQGSIVHVGMAMTNDLGRYEFANLSAGSYLLAVQAQPWYASNLIGLEPGSIGISGPRDPSLAVAYPITYYPGVTDPLQAAAIVLRPGDTSADLRLGAVPAIQLTFHNPAPPQRNARDGVDVAARNRPPQLFVSIFGTRQFVPASVQAVGGETVLSGFAPGDYLLSSSSSGPNGNPEPVHLSSSGPPDLPSQAKAVQLRLALRLPDGSAVPGRSAISLVTGHESSDPITAVANSKGEVDLTVSPADYFLQVTLGSEPAIVEQVLAGTAIIPANPLHIASPAPSAGSLAYTVTVVPANITVNGVAQRDGKPCPGAFILLVPAGELRNPRNWRTQQSDLDGSFDLSAVAPGSYLLFAIENGWQLKWRDVSVLSRYVPGALRVEIIDSSAHSQQLEHPVVVQPKL